MRSINNILRSAATLGGWPPAQSVASRFNYLSYKVDVTILTDFQYKNTVLLNTVTYISNIEYICLYLSEIIINSFKKYKHTMYTYRRNESAYILTT